MSTIVTPVNIELRKGRKRRPSHNLEDIEDPVMDDCMAAMVLMSLSCSPKSTFIPDRDIYSMSVKSIDSGLGSAASRSTTPSPTTTINEDSTASSIAIEINKVDESTIIVNKDEGIDMDETIDFIIDDPIKTNAEKARRIVFKCTWRGCGLRCDLVEEIEKHVRIVHLGRSEVAGEEENDHEEEFYYAEIEEEMEIDNISNIESSCSSDSSLGPLSPVSSSPESPVNSTNYHNLSPTLSPTSLLFFAPSPTWSHLDMARPPHEDPEYQKQQKQLQLRQQQQQQQQQANQKVQNVQTSVTQTILSAQSKPEPERKTVISSPINIPGISVAHRWSTKVHHRDSSAASSSSSSPSLSTSCNSSCSFSNFHHNHPNHQNHHHHPHLHHHHHPHFYHHHEHQSQTSLLGSSPSSFFSPKAPSKVMRLSCKSSSPININNKSTTSINATNSLHRAPTRTPSPLAMAGSINNTTAKLISSSNTNTISANTAKNGSIISSNNNINNQWTSLLQSSTSSASSTSSSLSSSSSSSSASSFISSASSSISSSPSTTQTTTTTKGHSISPSRRSRTETRKCRKVYGMDNRDSWCTQCKWKKACTRFVD